MRTAAIYLLLPGLALASAGFDTSSSGRAVEARRPLEAMVRIPAGTFRMGASKEVQNAAVQLCQEEVGSVYAKNCRPDQFQGEGPERRVFLSTFEIDRTEVTVQAYRRCVQAGVCSPQPLLNPDERFSAPNLPVTTVTFAEAERYCSWRGGRLPSEAEWERAARGRDGRTWPWGNVPRPNASNHGRIYTVGELSPTPYPVLQPDPSDGYAFLAPVGSFPEGASVEGLFDLAGNAMEWTADVYQEDPPQQHTSVNPHGPSAGSLRVVRGGSFRQPRLNQRTTARDAVLADLRSAELGFRCVR